MWKYIKGTEKDFEGFMPSSVVIIKNGCTIARREWIEEPSVETKSEEQQTLPDKEQINIADAMDKVPLPVLGA